MDVVRDIIAHEFGGARPTRVRREYGGSINECFIVDLPETGSGVAATATGAPTRVFVKVNDELAMFEAEAAGLGALAATRTIRLPVVHRVGRLGNAAYLILEFIPMGPARPTREAGFAALGRALARLHSTSKMTTTDRDDAGPLPPPPRGFGFATDNFLGLTPQRNDWTPSWIEFYARRLRDQLTRLEHSGVDTVDDDSEIEDDDDEEDDGARYKDRPSPGFIKRVTTVIDHLELFFDPEELATLTPSLLHGDLWQGNWGFTISEQTTEAVLFDPAAYWGHHEADLAMMTLFGDVPEAFYEAYHALVPKARGFEDRVPLYQLYHALNHYNLFGASYKSMCEQLLRPLLSHVVSRLRKSS